MAQEITKYEAVMRRLALPQLQQALKDSLAGRCDVPAYLQSVGRALQKNLQDSGDYAIIRRCTPDSIVESIRQGAVLGLRFDSALQHCYLIPFKEQCTMMIGYRGLLHILMRSGKVKKFTVHEVRACDRFKVEFGTTEKIEHQPDFELTNRDESPITHFYAVAHLDGYYATFAVMSKAEVDKVREQSKAKNHGKEGPAWAHHYVEMGKKTVLKRLCKLLDITPEAAAAVEMDNEQDEVILPAEVVDDTKNTPETPETPEIVKPQSKADKLAAKIGRPEPKTEELPGEIGSESPPTDEELFGSPDDIVVGDTR